MKRTLLNSPHARLRVAGRNLAAQSQSWRDLDLRAKAFISLVVAVGTGVLLYAAVYPTSKNIAQFICYLLIAILAARLKVHLPGITGTMSVNFLFILLVVSVLPGGSCIRRHAWLVQPGFRMGNFVADRSRYLPDLSLLPALSGKTRRREAACGGDGQPPPANHRSAGPGD